MSKDNSPFLNIQGKNQRKAVSQKKKIFANLLYKVNNPEIQNNSPLIVPVNILRRKLEFRRLKSFMNVEK